MSSRPIPRGQTSERVAANIRRIRLHQGLQHADLSRLLAEAGRPMSHQVISKIECGDRRIDVDDLEVFAHVLKLEPAALLAEIPSCNTCNNAPPKGFQCRICGAAA